MVMGIASLFYSIITTWLIFMFAKSNQQIVRPFDSIYQFGASLSDTGNLIRIGTTGPTLPAARLPYGQTFPGRPTGRWSDGRLMVDYIATVLGLPLLNPYLDKNASFTNGVNFAVAGSTALNLSCLSKKLGVQQIPNIPLSVQIDWFRAYLASICNSPPECRDRLRRALFFLGEIGRNDLQNALDQGRTVQEIEGYVPNIIDAIVNGTKQVVQLGARRIVVPGTFPIGCFPINLSKFQSQDPESYDDLGCLRNLNNVTILKNDLLQGALNSLRKEYPDIVILYSDYYGAFLSVLRRAPLLGFDPRFTQRTCCGSGGGQYNYDRNKTCGSPGVPVCPNPARYIQWDGIHPTQAAYRRISDIIIPNILSRIR